MVNLYIQKLGANANSQGIYPVILSFESTNFDTFSINYDLGITPNPLPENNADSLVLVKVTGNSLTESFSWTIKQQSVNKAIGSALGTNYLSQTIWEQLSVFDQIMQPTNTDNFYRIVIADSFTLTSDYVYSYSPSPYGYFYKQGLINNMKFNITNDKPTVISASVDFQVGNVVTVWQGDVASEPLNLISSSPSTGVVNLNWNTPLDAGGSAISGYIIQRKLLSDMTWTTITITGLVLNYSDTGLPSGNTYYYQIAAVNGEGIGDYTPEPVHQLVT